MESVVLLGLMGVGYLMKMNHRLITRQPRQNHLLMLQVIEKNFGCLGWITYYR